MPTDRSTVHEIRPLEDSRWDELVAGHARSSVFHTRAWLEALRRTYGYEPIAITTAAPGETLRNGVVFCRIESWITGRRWVSLPFSDHCEPLADSPADLRRLLAALEPAMAREKLRYLEIRPLTPVRNETDAPERGVWQKSLVYFFHEIDLTPPLPTLFQNCHKDSTQRKIRRAEREKLHYEEGRSEALLQDFYRLLTLTRRRQGLPPQPAKWFRNLAACFGEALKIRVASRDGRPMAAILTIRHRDSLVYKYGCSDTAFNNLGGMHLLFWTSISEARGDGLRTFDLGRSDMENQGLVTFKDRWGSARSTLVYATLNASAGAAPPTFTAAGNEWKDRAAKRLFTGLPDPLPRWIGALAYRHIG